MTKIELKFFDSEKELIEETFDLVEEYPVLLTYNGDGFDLPYLYNRACKIVGQNTAEYNHCMYRKGYKQ